MKNRDQIILDDKFNERSVREHTRLNILSELVWPEALVHPNQMQGIAQMIRMTLFHEHLTTDEIYKEARAIATYLNSMT